MALALKLTQPLQTATKSKRRWSDPRTERLSRLPDAKLATR